MEMKIKFCLFLVLIVSYSYAADQDEASTSSSVTQLNHDQENQTLKQEDMQFMADGQELLTQGIQELENPTDNTNENQTENAGKIARLNSYLKRVYSFSKKALYVAIRDMPTYLVSYLSLDPADKFILNTFLFSYYIDFAFQWIDSKLDSIQNQNDRDKLTKFRDFLNSMRYKVDTFNQGMIDTKRKDFKDIPWDKHMFK